MQPKIDTNFLSFNKLVTHERLGKSYEEVSVSRSKMTDESYEKIFPIQI